MIPGSNLMARAVRLIAQNKLSYQRFVSRTTNEIGLDVPEYEDAVDILGSIQPVPRQLYQQYGLDFQKRYVNLYAQIDVIDITRDVSGDLVTFAGRTYQLLSATDWFNIDGWAAVLCVEVENDGQQPN